MRVPLLDLKLQYASIRPQIDAAIARVVESQHFILGPEVEAFEKALAAYCGCLEAVGVSSGTDAILAALMAIGVGEGDEVVTTPNTFVATVSAIARVGAKAVFVDIEPSGLNLDVSKVEGAITSRTKAIIPVHLFGQMVDMEALMLVASRHGIAVIEDCAQAIGSEWNGRRAGSYGSMGCLSFFPSKNLGAYGDAGAVVTNDPVLAKRLRLIRVQGQEPKYFSKIVGGNFRLDAIQAAVLSAKLPHLDVWTAGRQRNAGRYRAMFSAAGVDPAKSRPDAKQSVTLPYELPGVRHIYNQFCIRSLRRDELRARLEREGIGSEVYYPQPMHLQSCFSSWGYKRGDFPEAEAAAVQSLAIPIFPEMTEDAQRAVVGVVASFHDRLP